MRKVDYAIVFTLLALVAWFVFIFYMTLQVLEHPGLPPEVGALLSTVAGSLNTLFGIGVGEAITYRVSSKVQREAWERQHVDRVIDSVHGPLLKEVDEISRALRNGTRPSVDKLKEIADRYLAVYLKEDLRNDLTLFLKRADIYIGLCKGVKGPAYQILREEAERSLRGKLDPQRVPHHITYWRSVDSENIDEAGEVLDALAMGKTPLQILEERPTIEGQKISAQVDGYGYPQREDVDNACKNTLMKLKEHTLFQRRENEKMVLIKKAWSLHMRLHEIVSQHRIE